MRIGSPNNSGPFPVFGPNEARIFVRQARSEADAPTLDRRALRRLDQQLRDLRGALGRLGRAGELVQTLRNGRSALAPVALSASPLDLEPYATFTRLGSTEEVNSIATSFTPRGPSFDGASTSLPTVGGVYDGEQGDDVLTFTARQNALVGSGQKLRVRIEDGEGKKIDELEFDDVATGEPLTLSNGLTLSLGAGFVFKDETFTVAVSTSVPSAVDPTQAFDGTRNDDPGFEPGLGVVAGSFEVNGVRIDVQADDSIDSVLARITASAAGVTASFDAATETLQLVQNTPGSAPPITLGSDTSGFLAATKLAGAAAVPGQDAVDPGGEVISSVSALDGISTGTFRVNGVQIAVDVDVDSLADVLDRINASGAGARADLDPDSLRVRVANDDPSATLTLSDGTSGFFAALQITPGAYEARQVVVGSRETRLQSARSVRPRLSDVRRALERVFARSTLPNPPAELERAREALRTALIDSVLDGEDARPNRLRTSLGLRFDLDDEAGKLISIDSQRLARALVDQPGELHELLFAAAGDEDVGGVVPALLSTIEGLQESIARTLDRHDRRGRLVDLRA